MTEPKEQKPCPCAQREKERLEAERKFRNERLALRDKLNGGTHEGSD